MSKKPLDLTKPLRFSGDKIPVTNIVRGVHYYLIEYYNLTRGLNSATYFTEKQISDSLENAPAGPREWFVNIYKNPLEMHQNEGYLHTSKENAEAGKAADTKIETVKVREVLNNE